MTLTFFSYKQSCLGQDLMSLAVEASNEPSLPTPILGPHSYFSQLVFEENVKITSIEEFGKYFDAYFGMIHTHLRQMGSDVLNDVGRNKITKVLQMYYDKSYTIYLQTITHSLDMASLDKDLKRLITVLFPNNQKRTHFQIRTAEKASKLLKNFHDILKLN
jgi:hypothetical protein